MKIIFKILFLSCAFLKLNAQQVLFNDTIWPAGNYGVATGNIIMINDSIAIANFITDGYEGLTQKIGYTKINVKTGDTISTKLYFKSEWYNLNIGGFANDLLNHHTVTI